MATVTAKEIASMLAGQTESVCRLLLPNGKVDGGYFVAGSIHGEEGKSLKVNLSGGKMGLWKDFASGEKGGDLLDLWCKTKGVSLGEAIRQAKAYLGVEDVVSEKQGKKRYKPPVVPKSVSPITRGHEAFKYLTEERKLLPETIKSFRVACEPGAIVLPFYECESSTLGMVKRLKVERKNGKKDIRPTSAEQKPILFGWQAVPDNAREVVLCEGEINAMSASQMGMPALATPFGAGKGEKHAWLAIEYDNLARFDKIYLWFDDDVPGRAAVADLPGRLGMERCWVIDGSKDANDVLKAKGDINALLSSATEVKPAFIAKMRDLVDELVDFQFSNNRPEGFTFPWISTHKIFRLRPGEVTFFGGYNSHGKTTALLQLVAYLVRRHYSEGIEICLATMEGNLAAQLVKILKFYCAQGGEPLPANKEEFEHLANIVGEAISVYNEPGAASVENVLESFRYARSRYGASLFIVDNLTSLDVSIEDYEGQRKFIQKILKFAKGENVHVIVVVHMRKPLNSEKVPDRYDFRGSGSVVDLVDNFYVFWRNENENPKLPPAVIRCNKDRENGEIIGRSLGFDKDVGFYEIDFKAEKGDWK